MATLCGKIVSAARRNVLYSSYRCATKGETPRLDNLLATSPPNVYVPKFRLPSLRNFCGLGSVRDGGYGDFLRPIVNVELFFMRIQWFLRSKFRFSGVGKLNLIRAPTEVTVSSKCNRTTFEGTIRFKLFTKRR